MHRLSSSLAKTLELGTFAVWTRNDITGLLTVGIKTVAVSAVSAVSVRLWVKTSCHSTLSHSWVLHCLACTIYLMCFKSLTININDRPPPSSPQYFGGLPPHLPLMTWHLDRPHWSEGHLDQWQCLGWNPQIFLQEFIVFFTMFHQSRQRKRMVYWVCIYIYWTIIIWYIYVCLIYLFIIIVYIFKYINIHTNNIILDHLPSTVPT